MRVNKKSLLAAGAVAVVATLGLAGCAGGDSGSDGEALASGTLTVWVDAERVDALQDAADAYTEKTGVKVELVGKDNADIKDDFIQQVPTGKGPDITMGAHDWLGELVDQRRRRADRARRLRRPTTCPSRSTRRPTRAPPTCFPTRSRTSRCCATPTSSPRPPRASTT